MHLVLNVKRQYKELKKAYEKNQQELNATKKNINQRKMSDNYSLRPTSAAENKLSKIKK